MILHARVQTLSSRRRVRVPSIASYEDLSLRERVGHAGSGPARTQSSTTPRIKHLTNTPVHCEIIPVREDDVRTARRLVEEALERLGALRQTVLVLELRANK
jgi:hypothetical protein